LGRIVKNMNKVFIAEANISTGVGKSLIDSWDNLYKSKCGINKIEHFNTDNIEFKYASCINGNRKNINLKLIKNTLNRLPVIPDNTFVIWTGIKGNAEAVENNSKSIILPAYYRKELCEYLNIKNTGIELNAACASSTAGIIYGAQLIASGRYNSVLVCASDIVSRFTHMGFAALKALSKESARPFDINRDGLNLGDGSCAVLLTDKDTSVKMGLKNLTKISGWGISNDANHITGPDRNASGLIDAIKKTLKTAGKKPEEIQAYCTHGTGTVYNDAMELTAIENIFGNRIFPVFSVKGAIGHTLGAAGGIEAALCSICLKEKKILPTTGLINPEQKAKARIMPGPQDFTGKNILTTNSGFGGVNASLLLEREQD
jgi:3-oxoacyl-[acyl-carrier-protein] synthase II